MRWLYMRKYVYRIHLDPEPEGGFTVTVPVLPGCVTWGENYEHALAMAQEAIEGYLEVLVEEGKPIPHEPLATPVDTVIQVVLPAVA
jgi:predicted RNase H-like HicB family nuclease